MTDAEPIAGRELVVHGFVQGVGFRPFVARLARRLGLAGSVRNEARGVVIRLEGTSAALDAFAVALLREAPPAARIESVDSTEHAAAGGNGFTIASSGPSAAPNVRVPRDLATCAPCAAEVQAPDDRRHGYPFTNCTACGPRFTILEGLPYDRRLTTMARFTMCVRCASEYSDPLDRRYHAEPIACPACGPQVEVWDRTGATLARGNEAIEVVGLALRDGLIVALQGLGGFQLLVRADDERAIARLRAAKNRPTKPLAVMVAEIDDARRLADIDSAEEAELAAPENPIVLVEKRSDARGRPAEGVAPRVGRIGLFLPTTPLHQGVLRAAGVPLIVTSGNRGDEPIVIEAEGAQRELSRIADRFLVHDRLIARRADDSVVQLVGGRRQAIRLGRGLAPRPLENLERWIARRGGAAATLAVGGQQKVAIGFWSGEQAILGPHIGDLDTREARADLESQTQRLTSLYGFVPERLACDLHPDYVTSRWADSQGLPTIGVQHHHAHAVAAMVEHDLLDEEVIALCWDGTGFGTDGTIWGGEMLRASVGGFQQMVSLWPIPLPGGERAIREPWRVALTALAEAIGPEEASRERLVGARLGIRAERAEQVLELMSRGLVDHASSIGRLFDVVAALVLGVREVSHEGEAAAWLEAVVDPSETGEYEMPLTRERPIVGEVLDRGDWRPMIRSIVSDLERGVAPGVIAARFHNALARWASECVARCGGLDVVLSGGCWVNRRLAEATLRQHESTGRRVYLAGEIPPNDGGLAVGQLAVAVAVAPAEGS